MKKLLYIAVIQLLLAIISAMLLAQMSLLGKLGIALFYKNYSILKSPILSGAIIFGVQFLIVLILHLFYLMGNRKLLRTICLLFLLVAILGLSYTIYDFRTEFSHRILKSKFHYGGYLVWIGIMLSTIYYFFVPKRAQTEEVNREELEG